MKIGVIQASSQADKNDMLYRCTVDALKKQGDTVINFGCFPYETEAFSYLDIAVEISLLLALRSVDFIVTGCSSGQGMMLACNSLPCVLCGYTPTPQDAFLFGRINNGNAVSLPLGLNFGWAGEINLKCTLESLFSAPFGTGYPAEDAARKKQDAIILKRINSLTKRNALEVFSAMDPGLLRKAFLRKNVVDDLTKNGQDPALQNFIAANSLKT